MEYSASSPAVHTLGSSEPEFLAKLRIAEAVSGLLQGGQCRSEVI
jgi:hypothetical protein